MDTYRQRQRDGQTHTQDCQNKPRSKHNDYSILKTKGRVSFQRHIPLLYCVFCVTTRIEIQVTHTHFQSAVYNIVMALGFSCCGDTGHDMWLQ